MNNKYFPRKGNPLKLTENIFQHFGLNYEGLSLKPYNKKFSLIIVFLNQGKQSKALA